MTVNRSVCMAIVLTLVVAFPLSAQDVAIGPQVLFGDYREVSSDLQYHGAGGGAALAITYRKLGADVAVGRITYKPHEGTATQEFDATQLDVRVRYVVTRTISAELGFTSREIEPELEAQSVGAVTAGAHMTYLLGPGVRMNLRGGFLFGAKFSGGGTSSPLGAMELGLGVGVDAWRGRLRLTGQYDFQRITREADDGSGEVEVPIQQSLGRVGLAIVF